MVLSSFPPPRLSFRSRMVIWLIFWASFGSIALPGLWKGTASAQAMGRRSATAMTNPVTTNPVTTPSRVADTVIAQRPSSIETARQSAEQVIIVSPSLGQDNQADGSHQSPFRTITQALSLAHPGTTIVLGPGLYSAETGEQFPIMLKPGVTIQGNPAERGRGVIIRGSGNFLSPTFARQSVAMVGADQATLTGITLTNPNPRGYGLWIESSSPLVVSNTFSQNVHDGVAVTGDSRPTIQDNYFRHNGANGITIYGTSRPVVRGNMLEDTGFGINIGQDAAPVLVDNRMWNNRSGVVVQGQARPVLRRNVMEYNEQDGLVAIAQSRPDLGTAEEPGQNRFVANGQSAINAEVAHHPVSAVGNTLDARQIRGAVNVVAIASPRITTPRSPATATPLAAAPSAASPTQAPVTNEQPDRSILSILATVPDTAPASPSGSPAAALSAENNGAESDGAESNGIDIAVVLPTVSVASTPDAVPPSRESAPALRQTVPPRPAIATPIAPIPSPSSETRTRSQTAPTSGNTPTTPARAMPARTAPAPAAPPAHLLPVPGIQVPEGHLGSMSTITVRANSLNDALLAAVPPGTLGSRALGRRATLRYRVLVAARTAADQQFVTTVVPDAFLTRVGGRTMMQVGAYGQLENANDIAREFVNYGLQAEVERLN